MMRRGLREVRIKVADELIKTFPPTSSITWTLTKLAMTTLISSIRMKTKSMTLPEAPRVPEQLAYSR